LQPCAYLHIVFHSVDGLLQSRGYMKSRCNDNIDIHCFI